jgi:hypothetical protein
MPLRHRTRKHLDRRRAQLALQSSRGVSARFSRRSQAGVLWPRLGAAYVPASAVSLTEVRPEDTELSARVMRAWDEHLAHPSLPRTLTSQLRAAEFDEIDRVTRSR